MAFGLPGYTSIYILCIYLSRVSSEVMFFGSARAKPKDQYEAGGLQRGPRAAADNWGGALPEFPDLRIPGFGIFIPGIADYKSLYPWNPNWGPLF